MNKMELGREDCLYSHLRCCRPGARKTANSKERGDDTPYMQDGQGRNFGGCGRRAHTAGGRRGIGGAGGPSLHVEAKKRRAATPGAVGHNQPEVGPGASEGEGGSRRARRVTKRGRP